MSRTLTLLLLLSLWTQSLASAGEFGDSIGGPSGWPGIPHHWSPALKQAVGTSYETNNGAASPVWFTVAEGAVSEVFYPHIDTAQVGFLEFIVTDGRGYFSEQRGDTRPQVSFVGDGMGVHIVGSDRLGLYTYEQDIVTDSAEPVLRIHTRFHWQQPGLKAYILFKPTLNNSGADNFGLTGQDGLFAYSGSFDANPTRPAQPDLSSLNPHNSEPIYLALLSSAGWNTTSAGYVGFSDGWQDLSQNFRLTELWNQIGPGNIALTGEVKLNENPDFDLDLALGFGGSRSEAVTYATTSLSVPFEEVQKTYEDGWLDYLEGLIHSPKLGYSKLSEKAFVRRSAEIIKMHEDKRRRGAIVSSLSKPGIPAGSRASNDVIGYHHVVPSDLYLAAMGLMAAGDSTTPVQVLKYFTHTQSGDGSWASDLWVDGSACFDQNPEVDSAAYPILLAHQVQSRGIYKLDRDDLEMVRKAVAFILARGPSNRGPDNPEYTPGTLALETAALRLGSSLTQDRWASSIANQWQAFIEKWTLAGTDSDRYYLRSSTLRKEIDGEFLNLVRLGIRSASDPRVVETVKRYDDPNEGLASLNRAGELIFRRFVGDPYGEAGVGGFWPYLAGRRGNYDVAVNHLDEARSELSVLEQSAYPNGLIPEQMISPSTSTLHLGSGVAAPLVKAHAEAILLDRSIEEGNVFDTPQYR